jgi:type I restriction enzyme S subunit
MKTNWQTKKIGNVCTVIAGQSPEGKFYNKLGKGLPFYQGKKDFGEKFIEKPTVWTTQVTKEAEKGDILMSVRAPVGPINFATEKICIGRGLAAIRTSGELDKNLLFYFFKMFEDRLIGNSGTVFNSINKNQIENIEIPLPPLSEQKRIVKILDESFEKLEKAKENSEKNLQNSKELFESYLNDIFSNPGKDWEKKALIDLIKLEYGKPLPDSKRKLDGKYPVYGANGVKGRADEFYFDNPSIIVGRKGTAGAINLTEEKFWPLDVTYFITFDDKRYELKFIYYLLSTLNLPKLAKGVKPGINRNDVYSLMVSVSKSLQEQKAIVKKLDQLSEKTKKLESLYKQKIESIEELKKSILQKAFSGEL